jgi:hypothetical protein
MFRTVDRTGRMKDPLVVMMDVVTEKVSRLPSPVPDQLAVPDRSGPAIPPDQARHRQHHRLQRVTETTVDQLAEADLRLLGVPPDEAARLAVLPLPDTGTW